MQIYDVNRNYKFCNGHYFHGNHLSKLIKKSLNDHLISGKFNEVHLVALKICQGISRITLPDFAASTWERD